jgi:hypothetical protein
MSRRVFNCGAANAPEPEQPNRHTTDARGVLGEAACLSRHAIGPMR